MIDHISELLFAPTEEEKENLIKDNVKGRIFVVGNTIVDAIYQNLEVAKAKSSILNGLNLRSNDYLVLTLHREENVDYRENLEQIVDSLRAIAHEHGSQIIYPIHPRTKKRLKEFDLEGKAKSIQNLRIIEPLGYLDFLLLLSNASLALTDSGGIQEETCILKVPCVTLRESTERPQTVKVGANYIAGVKTNKVQKGVSLMLQAKREWANPFGDTGAAERIITIVKKDMVN